MPDTTVYLVDDEPDLLELLSDVASFAGLKSHCFTRASHFFSEVSEFEPGSILVLDLHMPEMDGIEVMRRLAEMGSSPAIILMSGRDNSVLHSAEKLGNAHQLELIASLSKPIDLAKFQQLLEQYSKKNKHQNMRKNEPDSRFLGPADLLRAISNNELVLHYQPQIDIATEQVIGVEALVRWQHPNMGLIFPDLFIPMSEKEGIIGELTYWVIEKAVHQEQQWQAEGILIAVSVNISAVDITSLTLPEQLAKLLEDKKLDPTRLNLEVTEGALMGELVTSLDIMTRLRLKGFGLSIDSFVTGYSSLSQLHKVPFSELKIDRSFVSNMEYDDEARAIVKTCIILGHELKMKVIAEGVETAGQLEILKQFNCDYAQGYLYSKPVEAHILRNLLFEQSEKHSIEDKKASSPPPLTWSEKFSVGIPLIDEDHKHLVHLLDQCRAVVKKQASTAMMNEVISELIKYTKVHFKREEALMAACDYPELESHQKNHEAIINKVEKMNQEHKQGKLSRGKLIIFLTEWLLGHIGTKDIEMAKTCLNKPECIDTVSKKLKYTL